MTASASSSASSSVPVAPGPRVVLHVGTMKSGTTSIQASLFAHRGDLAQLGVVPLGERWAHQVAGVQGLIRDPAAPGPRWEQLAAQARDASGTCVLSVELMGPFAPRKVRAAVESFGDVPVDVVVTVRDLGRTVPSLWQETVQNGRGWSWADYRRGAQEANPYGDAAGQVSEAGRTFWRQQDAARIVQRWADVVGPDRVHVVTLPPPGGAGSALLDRFGGVVGLPEGGLAAVRPRNTAIGAASARLLQLLNAELDERGVGDRAAKTWRKHLLAKQVLAERRPLEDPIGFTVPAWVSDAAAAMVQRLRGSGAQLHGDWADLLPVDVPGADPDAVADDELVAAGQHALAGLAEASELVAPVPQGEGVTDVVAALADLVAARLAQEPA